jgi:membrane-bound lytic murein transglycosylase MltF
MIEQSGGTMRYFLAIVLAAGLALAPGARAETIALPSLKPWSGDFDGMLKRRAVRVLVPVSKTSFYINKGEAFGIDAEYGEELERWLNKRHVLKPYKIHVALIPTPRDRLLPDLVAGKGDVVFGNLTVTPERQALVDFTTPLASGVKEALVTGPAAADVKSIDDLGGKTILVRKSSSYYTHLLALNDARKAAKLALIDIKPADENLEDEDLLQMVNSGILPWMVVDRFKGKLWASVLKNLTVHDDILINEGGDLAWAIRKNSPLLQKELNEFVAGHKYGTDFGSDLALRYFRTGKLLKNALAASEADKLNVLLVYFDKSGQKFSVDPLLLAAQGYQESQLNQKLKNRSGAVGVMQMKPSTAREKEIAIQGIDRSAENNILAASKYLRFLTEKYINDPDISANDRVLMAMAAYNAGPGNLKKFRAYAAEHGFKTNVWFGNVENGAAAIVGQETVQYIGNIYKYYIAYSILRTTKDTADATR